MDIGAAYLAAKRAQQHGARLYLRLVERAQLEWRSRRRHYNSLDHLAISPLPALYASWVMRHGSIPVG
jgi:hypothetical protein